MYKRVFALFVTFALTCNFAIALTCGGLFVKPSVYGESFAPLNDLNAASKKFIQEVLNHQLVLDPLVVHSRILELENLSEKYLISAGIPFSKTLSLFNLKDKNGKTIHSTGHGVYHLQGSRYGDETARLLEGIFANSRLHAQPLQVLFDPLYGLNHPNSVGHFDPQTRLLLIGPNVIVEGTKGIRSTLRHEIQHYLEQIEILHGKMSLGRLSFWESNPKQEIPYAKYIRLDELETHLRDLREVLNARMALAKDKKLTKAVNSEETMQEIRSERKKAAIDKENKIHRMLNHAEMMVHGIKRALETSEYTVRTFKDLNKVEIAIKGLSGPYSEVRIDLTSIVPLEKSQDRKEIESAMQTILKWTEQRVREIEKRVLDLPRP